jgi:hypothetical protein
MAKDNVVEFPFDRISNPLAGKDPVYQLDHELDVTREVMTAIIQTLQEYQYYASKDAKIFEDLGIIFNLVYAMLLRYDNEHHDWHEMMDEITRVTLEMKEKWNDNS